jgi:ligand-binding SRPBCC domain-containing protein
VDEAGIQMVPSPTGRGYRLTAAQFIPQPRERVFEFFSDAFQLEALTPAWVGFSVLTPAPICIAVGTLIDYRLKLHGIPIQWQSRISVWEPGRRFVDEQTRGPYRRWQHEHVFETCDGGTLCRDMVEYEVYGGSIINALFVRPDLLKIFAYRQTKLRELLPAGHSMETLSESISR